MAELKFLCVHMFASASKSNYLIVLTPELINQYVWESSERAGSAASEEEEEDDDRVFTVSPKCAMKSRSVK